jgi:hypothetical protein
VSTLAARAGDAAVVPTNNLPVVTGLDSNTAYVCYVQALNVLGDACSVGVAVRTFDFMPSPPPPPPPPPPPSGQVANPAPPSG